MHGLYLVNARDRAELKDFWCFFEKRQVFINAGPYFEWYGSKISSTI